MRTLLLWSGLFLTLTTKGQDYIRQRKSPLIHGLFSYDFPHSYGLTVAGSFPLLSNTLKKPQNLHRTKFISAELAGYRYPFEYTLLSANVAVGIRYIHSATFFTELRFHQGILRSVYDGKVYELEANGTIKEANLGGRTYLTSGFSYSLNWALSRASSNPWFIQFRPFLWAQYPYNSFVHMHVSLQLGISYRLGKYRSL